MVRACLNWFLAKLEIDPPILSDADWNEYGPAIRAMFAPEIARPTVSEAAATCTECGHRGQIEFLSDANSRTQHAYLPCPVCGPTEIPLESLRRWQIDIPVLVESAFAGARLALREVVPGKLWYIGRTTWAGRSRELYFATGLGRATKDVAASELATHPKAILFTPTEGEIRSYGHLLKNLALSFERSLNFQENKALVDVEYVESRVNESRTANGRAVKPRPKRASRLSAIEKLTKYMIEHLRSARDHAHATLEMCGSPQLLPRPKQKELAEQLNLSEDKVSRSMNDSQARELQIYYKIAADIDQILAWSGPVSAGGKKQNRS